MSQEGPNIITETDLVPEIPSLSYTKDNLTGLFTPFGERLAVGGKPVMGRIFLDWQNMHGAYQRYEDNEIEKELQRISAFVAYTFSPYESTFPTYISGDSIIVTSTTYDVAQLLHILREKQPDFQSIATLVCGEGFPDDLTQEVYNYWCNHPDHRFQRVEPPPNKTVCAVDLRHLRAVTEKYGMDSVELDILLLHRSMQQQFRNDQVHRTRSDEFWISSVSSISDLEKEMEDFTLNYKGGLLKALFYDWGVGKRLGEAHKNLKQRKEDAGIVRTETGLYIYTNAKS